jgi:hypothetical protein
MSTGGGSCCALWQLVDIKDIRAIRAIELLQWLNLTRLNSTHKSRLVDAVPHASEL